jgi:hypothetical protein
MKKVFAIFIAMLLVASFSVVGCKKAEETAPAEVPAVEAPVAPATDAAPAPEAAPEAPAAEAAK